MNNIWEFVDGLRERQSAFRGGIRELLGDVDIKKAACNAFALAVGIFLSRCSIMDTIHPFGQGYFVCMLIYSSYYKAAFAGCYIGWLSLFPDIPFSGMLVSASCMGILMLVSHKYRVERGRLLKTVYIFFSILSIFLFNMSGRFFAAVGVFEAAVSVICLFIYDKTAVALFVHKKRSRLTDDEAICVVFCLCTLVIFTGGMKLGAFEVNTVLAGLITMGFGYIFGSTVGAAAGVLCGLCVSLGGGSIYIMGSMGVCGFFGGLAAGFHRLGSIAAYIVANSLLTIYINGSSFVILPIQSSLASGALLIAIPPALMEQIKELLCNTLNKSREERYYVEKYNRLAKEKIDNLSKLFKTMSELFCDTARLSSYTDVEISSIIEEAAEDACKNCVNHQRCWEKDFLYTYGGFEEMIENYLLEQKFCEAEIKECINEAGVISSVKKAADRARIINKNRISKDDGNELLSKQFKGISSLLSGMNGEIKNDVRFESDIEKNIRDELTLFDVMVHDVCVMNIAGAYRCEVGVNGCGGGRECKYKIEKTVSKFCGKPMVLVDSLCDGRKNQRCRLTYVMAKPLKVNTFMAQASKEDICGDSYKLGFVSDNKYMLCISDGMGSGKSARDESSACVDLLYGFFKAGFEDNVIFETVNKLLMLKSEEEIFTTVDLCIVDVTRSRICFTKIGAVPSVIIKNNGDVCVIKGDSLPLGILEEVNEKSFEIDVEDGDILVMFTDGVYDALCSQDVEIDKAIMDIAKDNKDIRKITSDIIAVCKGENPAENKDDMTILISMFKKEKGCQ